MKDTAMHLLPISNYTKLEARDVADIVTNLMLPDYRISYAYKSVFKNSIEYLFDIEYIGRTPIELKGGSIVERGEAVNNDSYLSIKIEGYSGILNENHAMSLFMTAEAYLQCIREIECNDWNKAAPGYE